MFLVFYNIHNSLTSISFQKMNFTFILILEILCMNKGECTGEGGCWGEGRAETPQARRLALKPGWVSTTKTNDVGKNAHQK